MLFPRAMPRSDSYSLRDSTIPAPLSCACAAASLNVLRSAGCLYDPRLTRTSSFFFLFSCIGRDVTTCLGPKQFSLLHPNSWGVVVSRFVVLLLKYPTLKLPAHEFKPRVRFGVGQQLSLVFPFACPRFRLSAFYLLLSDFRIPPRIMSTSRPSFLVPFPSAPPFTLLGKVRLSPHNLTPVTAV